MRQMQSQFCREHIPCSTHQRWLVRSVNWDNTPENQIVRRIPVPPRLQLPAKPIQDTFLPPFSPKIHDPYPGCSTCHDDEPILQCDRLRRVPPCPGHCNACGVQTNPPSYSRAPPSVGCSYLLFSGLQSSQVTGLYQLPVSLMS